MRKLVAAALVTLAVVVAPTFAARARAALGDCGQPATAGSAPVASDALFTLRAAVGTGQCEPCVCDVDDNGATTAGDALRILRVAVGQPETLDCPACAPPACGSAAAPECGGTCSDGLTCAPEPANPESCACLDPCQASEAPACGGSCELLGQPALVCQLVTVTAQESPEIAFCECLPAGIRACTDAEAPACAGVCRPGGLCAHDGDSACVCTPLALQPPCEEADAPACAGICGSETICEADGTGGCACVPLAGEAETCASENAPACAGVCAGGKTCSVNFDFSCNCFSPCEIGEAPACGGTCVDATRSCVPATSVLGDGSIEHCVCR